MADTVTFAFVYGSMAAGTEHPGSDVDLMVLGHVGFAGLARALAGAQATLRREVNPTVTTPREFEAGRGTAPPRGACVR